MAPLATEKWWTGDTVAVVTGANKGIGFEIARALGKQGLHVVVTSRDEGRGRAAIDKLSELEPSSSFTYCQADITDGASVRACADTVKEKLGKVDVLVNNAGIAFKGNIFGADEAQATIDCNFKGTKAMTEALLPLIPEGGRIVNVCSESGHLRQLKSDELKRNFQEPQSADALVELADQFPADIRAGVYQKKGWSTSMYGVSKLAEIAYTMWLARELQPKGIFVNAICPGWCQTDMSSQSGPGTAASGADTPVWVALQAPKDAQTGKFFSGRRELVW